MNSEKYVYEPTKLDALPEHLLGKLTPESRGCIERLLAHDEPEPIDFGPVKQAAVLVALFQRKGGDLEVILTTRAKHLRRHPSQTALPGGRADAEDHSFYHTARREAFEEVGLPLHCTSIIYLTTLEPVVTVLPLGSHYRNHIAVTPIVCFLSDPSIVDDLRASPDEVDYVFTHPLAAVLNGTPGAAYVDRLQPKGGEWWPHEEEYHSISDRLGVTGPHRMHRFRTCQSPIKGLTADVLIQTAEIAFGRPTSYTRYAPGQIPFSDLIPVIVKALPAILEQDERDRVAGKVVKAGPVTWGALDGGPGVASRESWAQA